ALKAKAAPSEAHLQSGTRPHRLAEERAVWKLVRVLFGRLPAALQQRLLGGETVGRVELLQAAAWDDVPDLPAAAAADDDDDDDDGSDGGDGGTLGEGL
ncbi:MAG: hypothetical protein VX075_16355, partial [Pseudomonadota bacterium]|nr:hypothetical protein [Pseudomonadota bacterium]